MEDEVRVGCCSSALDDSKLLSTHCGQTRKLQARIAVGDGHRMSRFRRILRPNAGWQQEKQNCEQSLSHWRLFPKLSRASHRRGNSAPRNLCLSLGKHYNAGAPRCALQLESVGTGGDRCQIQLFKRLALLIWLCRINSAMCDRAEKQFLLLYATRSRFSDKFVAVLHVISSSICLIG